MVNSMQDGPYDYRQRPKDKFYISREEVAKARYPNDADLILKGQVIW